MKPKNIRDKRIVKLEKNRRDERLQKKRCDKNEI